MTPEEQVKFKPMIMKRLPGANMTFEDKKKYYHELKGEKTNETEKPAGEQKPLEEFEAS